MNLLNLSYIRRNSIAAILVLAIAVSVAACGLSLTNSIEAGKISSGSAIVTKLSTITAKPGETVQITGSNFSKDKSMRARITLSDGSKKDVLLDIASATSASFKMPQGVGLGYKSLSIFQGTTTDLGRFSIVSNESTNTLPILIIDQEKVCNDIDYIDKNGDKKTGSKSCGSSSAVADCTAGGQTGCKTTSAYISAESSLLTVGNIKSGVVIAGVTGQYPNSTYKLPGSSGTDLITATFNAQITSSSTFQYFDSAGARYTGTGDTNILAANILTGTTIFGTAGSATVATTPSAWDVRVGTTINGVAGKLRVNCRNRINSTLYNYDNPGAFSIPNTVVTTGTTLDIWDTTDDYNNAAAGLPPSFVSGWTTSTDCAGIEAAADDNNVWKDVTVAGSGAATCTGSPENCTMKDKISGLWWTKTQATSTWSAAWSTCRGLTYNGQTGWRLPTQKELIDSYSHGLRSATSTNWITEATTVNYFWSGTTVSNYPDYAVIFETGYGGSNYSGCPNKSGSLQFVCVR